MSSMVFEGEEREEEKKIIGTKLGDLSIPRRFKHRCGKMKFDHLISSHMSHRGFLSMHRINIFFI